MRSELGVGVHVVIAAEALRETKREANLLGGTGRQTAAAAATGQRFTLLRLLQKIVTRVASIKTEITLLEFGSPGSWAQRGKVLVRFWLQTLESSLHPQV